jgi:hypothetical protein
MTDESTRRSHDVRPPVEGPAIRESLERTRPLKPTLVKPEAQPRKDFVDFYAIEVT